MCGICAYIGSRDAKNYLKEALYKLEYRGYDSAGVVLKNNENIAVVKSKGEIDKLVEKLSKIKGDYSFGMGHTRWATHGKVSEENAHPHISNDGNWFLIHNGIIENANEIKRYLLGKGYNFVSKTDTELSVNLIQDDSFKYSNKMQLFINVCNKLKGSFAFVCFNRNENKMYLARRNSPLYVGKNKNGESFVSSDIALLSGVEECYVLEDNEFAEVEFGGICFYNKEGKSIEKSVMQKRFDVTTEFDRKVECYMEKEIAEIPSVLHKTADNFNKIVAKVLGEKFIKNISEIEVVACGTAYHSGLMGARYIEKIAHIPVKVSVASEFRYSKPILNKNTLYVFVSQSGETADTLACAKMIKQKKLKSLAITNVEHSSLNMLVDRVIPTCAGLEIAVASTKAFNCQVLVFYLLAKYFARKKCTSVLKATRSLKLLRFDSEVVDNVVKSNKIFFIGRDEDYVTCLEASLKLKETTYKNCVAIQSGELKHGPLALIDDETVVFVVSTIRDLVEKTVNAIHEIKARGGKVYVASLFPKECFGDIDYYFDLSSCCSSKIIPASITSIVPFQYLALDVCRGLGLNPDKPRNLAKSVTVE